MGAVGTTDGVTYGAEDDAMPGGGGGRIEARRQVELGAELRPEVRFEIEPITGFYV